MARATVLHGRDRTVSVEASARLHPNIWREANEASSSWTIGVLVVDAHRLAAEAMATVLRSAPNVELVGVIGDANLAVSRAKQARPDVVLIHDPIADQPVAPAIAAIHAAAPRSRVLVVADWVDEERVTSWMRAGAVGCVVEYYSMARLIRTIELAHAGETLFPGSPTAAVLGGRFGTQKHGDIGGRPTARELEVLEALADGLTVEEIAERLTVSHHTVRVHIKRVMSKLEARSRLDAVVRAVRAGLIQLT